MVHVTLKEPANRQWHKMDKAKAASQWPWSSEKLLLLTKALLNMVVMAAIK